VKTQRDIDKWFAEQVLPHERKYLSLAQRLMGGRESAQDAVQEAYQEIVAGRMWQSISNARAYTMQVVHNRCVSRLRVKRIPAVALPDFDMLALSDPNPDAFDALAAKEQLRRVEAVLRKMPLHLRRVFWMRRVDGLSHSAIADTLKIHERTVRKHMDQAVFLFSKYLLELEVPEQRRGLFNFKRRLPK